MHKGIWAFAEARQGGFPETSLEVICEARRLAELTGDEASVIALGDGVRENLQVPFLHGARRLYRSSRAETLRYAPELYTALVAGVVAQERGSILLFPSSDVGRDLAPRVAARLGTGLVPACDKLEISPEGLLLMTRLTLGGKAQATYLCRHARPQIALIEPGVAKIRMIPPPPDEPPPEVRIIEQQIHVADVGRLQVTGFIKADPKTMDIADAEIIVAGGKGAGGRDGFALLWELADLVGGAVAGSRMAVDNGCIGRERQIGQSGKTVAPELLISCGISGANAHIAGMRESKTVIAVNKDQHAPMMKRADLGVVGDLHEVLPILIGMLRGA